MDSIKEKYFKLERDASKARYLFENLKTDISVACISDETVKLKIETLANNLEMKLKEIMDLEKELQTFKQKIMATKTVYRRECDGKKEEIEKIEVEKKDLVDRMERANEMLNTMKNVLEAEQNAVNGLKETRENLKTAQQNISKTSDYLSLFGIGCRLLSYLCPELAMVESFTTVVANATSTAQGLDILTAHSTLIKPSNEKIETLDEEIAEKSLLIDEMKKSIETMELKSKNCVLSICSTEKMINQTEKDIKELNEFQEKIKTLILKLSQSLQFLIEIEPKARRICNNIDLSDKIFQAAVEDFKETFRSNDVTFIMNDNFMLK